MTIFGHNTQNDIKPMINHQVERRVEINQKKKEPKVLASRLDRTKHIAQRDIECIAAAMHFEARGEPIEGQIAVGEVIIARTHDHKWPSTACKVVKQRSQFSFVKNGAIPQIPKNCRHKHERMAKEVVAGKVRTRLNGSVYFHANYVKPLWRKSMKMTGRIGRHIFYRSKKA